MSNAVAKRQKGDMLRDLLNGEKATKEMARILPKHVTPERMVRVALTALTRTPKLAECDPQSFMKCMMDLSQWGLEPDGRRAHLIPFRNRSKNIVECQLIIDYKGLAELVYRSGTVKKIHADVVRDGDVFLYDIGEVKAHVPHFLRRDASKPKEAGEVYAAYCLVEMDNQITKADVMSYEEIEAIRARSKSGKDGPWVTDWNEMAKKTVFRRLSKWLPLSADIRDAVEKDDDVIDATSRPVDHLRISDASEIGELRKAKQNGQPATDDDHGGEPDDAGDDGAPPEKPELNETAQSFYDEINKTGNVGMLQEFSDTVAESKDINDEQRQWLFSEINWRIEELEVQK